MTESNLAISRSVVIACPACGAAEQADAAMLVDAPTIVCRKCGETWPGAEPRRVRAQMSGRGTRHEPKILQSEKRPLVTYSEGVDKAWAKKVEGDVLPELPQRSRMPTMIAATAAVLFIGAFLGGRDPAVTAMPDLAGLYSALGIPVNLDRLVIESVEAERTTSANGDTLTGAIRNVSGEERAVPSLTASLLDSARAPAGARGYDPPAPTIGPGEAVSFLIEIGDAPARTTEVSLKFRHPAERLLAETEGSSRAP